jgi:Right handed beta helix region
MKRILLGTLMLLLLPGLISAQPSTASVAVKVDCSKGQSLNRALSKLEKHNAATVTVNGTCSEYVQVNGLENLTLRGLPGASIVEPAAGTSDLLTAVLFIGSSRNVTVSGFNIQAAGTTGLSAVGIGHGSSDIRLLNLQVQGGGAGIVVFENSQVLLSHVTGENAGYAAFAIFDSSDAHVEHCLFQDTTGTSWHAGINVGAAHVTMFDNTIRDFQVGITAGAGGIVDLVAYNSYTPPGGPTDVLIDSPSGNNFNGVQLSSGSSLNLGNGARLVINQPGQPWGGTTGGILVSDGSTLTAFNGELAITGSHGQGIVVENNSHATIAGVSVTGSGHGGVVVVNTSTLDVSPQSGLTLIGGNGVDLFCDQSSMITGGANLAGIPSSQCNNVSNEEAALP